MRTLSSTLAAAQRASPQIPRIGVIVRDKTPRLVDIGMQGSAAQNVQADMCTADDGTTIVIAALDTSGNVRIGRVTASPATWGNWPAYSSGYSTIHTGALAWGSGGDVAISLNGSTLRVFFVQQVGGFYSLRCRESTDQGATWGSAIDVLTGNFDSSWCLASAGNDDVFFSRDPFVEAVYHMKKSGGSWGSSTSLGNLVSSGSQYEVIGGLAALWTASG
jgi:hypothetical protein